MNTFGRRKWLSSFLVLAVLGLFAGLTVGDEGAVVSRVSAQSDETLVVIINGRNPTNTLGLAEVKKLFLGQTSFWHGVVPVKVVTRPDGSASAKAFYGALGMTPQSFGKQWNELQLAGRGVAPKPLATIQDVASAVAQMPGGIGFALASEGWNVQLKGVKIIPVR